MLTFINPLLIAALAIVSPREGSEVGLLRDAQRDYLEKPTAERRRLFDDGAYRVELAKATGAPRPVRLEWSGAGETSVVTIDGESTEVTNASSILVTNLEPGKTYRWSVKSGNEIVHSSFTADPTLPRLLYISGLDNIRDCGGWKGLDGKRVRYNRIFRTSGLRRSSKKRGTGLVANAYTAGSTNITAVGLQQIKTLKIKTELELRTKEETIHLKSSILGDDVNWCAEPFVAYQYIDGFARGREPFARIFRQFLDEKNYPILMHCSGGRDRTGTLVFILNGLLGVSDDDLGRDWEASAFCDDALTFGTSRIKRLENYLKGLGGETLAENCEIYVRSCGISDEEIARFRELMLEGGGK